MRQAERRAVVVRREEQAADELAALLTTEVTCPTCGTLQDYQKLCIVQIYSPFAFRGTDEPRMLRHGYLCGVETCCQPIWTVEGA